MRLSNRSVLITGCSSGIGLGLARALREQGWKVFPTVKSSFDQIALREEGFNPFVLDVTSSDSISTALEQVLGVNGGPVGALINNAGYELIGAIEDLTREAIRNQFETNVFGAVELTGRLLSHFKKAGEGRIMFVGSAACSRVGFPFSGAYCASKHALAAVAESLRRELRGTNILVTLVEPGLFKSQTIDNAERIFREYMQGRRSDYLLIYERMFLGFRRSMEGLGYKEAGIVAQEVCRALESPVMPARIIVPRASAIYDMFKRFVPTFLQDELIYWKMKNKDKVF